MDQQVNAHHPDGRDDDDHHDDDDDDDTHKLVYSTETMR